ncbi:MAG: M20 family metallopeptidase [Pseudomonadota bacterium]
MTFSPTESLVLAWLEAHAAEMVTLLERLVNVDSGSRDVAGVDEVGDILRRFLDDATVTIEVIPGQRSGYALRATVPGAGGRNEPGHVLLMGHRDTVFPHGEAARRPFRVEDGKAYGPGVADMKAGLVLNAFVQAALQSQGGAPLPVVGLYTADEEIASPEGRAVIEATAEGARAVFNAEPGRPGGGVVTQRNGALFCDVEITGVAAHSGANHAKGRSAIDVLARKVRALHALTDYEAGITVNVGTVSGGEAVNTVAPQAEFGFDVRFPTKADFARIEPTVMGILQTTEIDGTTTRLVTKRLFMPVEAEPENDALYDHYARAASALELMVEPAFSGGSADSGFTSALGVPTLCGTGPIGEHAHTPNEVCHLDTLLPRAKTLALAVLRLPSGDAGPTGQPG